jgi:peptide subunit release factor RF-3
MIKEMNIEPVKTYKTKENAIKAVNKMINLPEKECFRYFIHTHTDGRFFPVFVGTNVLPYGVHFHFNVIA